MKAKKVTKKLVLNKETLSNLDDLQMKDVKGGWNIHVPTHDPCTTEC